MNWFIHLKALLGISTYTKAPLQALSADRVDSVRKAFGGQIQPQPQTRTEWYLADVDDAESEADGGRLETVAQMMRSARGDGYVAGVLSTRTDGLVRLPRIFKGRADIIAALEAGHVETRSVFDEMFPPGELALLAADGITCGVGVGELVPVEGRDYPVFIRLDPEFLVYRWSENRWYFRSIAGLIPITPGDGRWILHTPGGRNAPWQNGLWKALARSYIRKSTAQGLKDNWESKLANAARVAVSPSGASERQKQSWFQRVMAWGTNTVFALTPGYDVRLVESNGRGHESFDATVDRSNTEISIAIAGQTVTVDGGAGFANAGIHKSIRGDLIQSTGDGLAYTINTQGLPIFIVLRFGEQALYDGGAVFSYDVTPPEDRTREATAALTAANAATAWSAALKEAGHELDLEAFCATYRIPLRRAVQAANGRQLSLVREAA